MRLSSTSNARPQPASHRLQLLSTVVAITALPSRADHPTFSPWPASPPPQRRWADRAGRVAGQQRWRCAATTRGAAPVVPQFHFAPEGTETTEGHGVEACAE